MLDKTASIVGEEAAKSWRYLLRGLWESALRVDELMHVSWDEENTIRPIWKPGKLATLAIPHHKQKNATEEEIPLLPCFEILLLETPEAERTGWVFNPVSLQTKVGRRVRQKRPDAEWTGKVISRIGKAAGVIVEQGNAETGKPKKFASAHDLRRSCADRLLDAGVPPTNIARLLRHSNWQTTQRYYAMGEVQKDARIIRELLD
ncbi:Tyrosine recombinase XerC [Lignipirellula cremea]|uniref:Tyrosine recombinase XerC n=2 Tax=Lignipirellula cremea TaxID=2528010 RepID=A0A518DLL4_9BACT|nr:Tyrosine recombinase XerC [Lignipirellula cremea]